MTHPEIIPTRSFRSRSQALRQRLQQDGVTLTTFREQLRNQLLLSRVLREEWKFGGYVYSDYGGVQMLHAFHRTAATPAFFGR